MEDQGESWVDDRGYFFREYVWNLDEEDQVGDQVFHRMVWNPAGAFIDFLLEQQIRIDDGYRPVVRWTWRDGTVNVEEFSRRRQEPINSFPGYTEVRTVGEGFTSASAKLYEDWNKQRRRFLDG